MALGCVIVFKWVLMPAHLDGASMEPTYHDGDFHFINRLAYRSQEPLRGDVVAIHLAGKKTFYLKRIVGLPGESISLDHGVVHIDGTPLDEPYLVNRGTWTMPSQIVPPFSYYVVGDNRDNPIQGHRHGMVRRNKIIGRIL